MFKAAKKLLGKNDELAYLDYSDNVALVNVIGRYFVDKIDGIRSDIDAMDVALDPYSHCLRNAVPKDLEVDDIQTLSDFQLLTEDDVNSLIQKSAKKSCTLDPTPTSLVVNYRISLSKNLSFIYMYNNNK